MKLHIIFTPPNLPSRGEVPKAVGFVIQPLTDIGEVTARILDFNNDDRIKERLFLIEVGKYPSPAAKARMSK